MYNLAEVRIKISRWLKERKKPEKVLHTNLTIKLHHSRSFNDIMNPKSMVIRLKTHHITQVMTT